MIDVPFDRFEELVADAIDTVPDELARYMDNVAVFVEDGTDPHLLGHYHGIPLTQRRDYGGMVMPDRITIYRLAICARARTEDEVVRQVRITVVHEIAHHFGIGDARLRELGYG